MLSKQSEISKKIRAMPGIPVWIYCLLYALATQLLYQHALMSFTLAHSEVTGFYGLKLHAVLQIVPFAFTAILLLILGFVSPLLMKICGAVLFLVNSAAQFFMVRFGTIMDTIMIQNILGTTSEESSGLLSWSLVSYVLMMGALPAVILIILPTRRQARLHSLAALLGTIALLGGTVFSASSTWTWFDENGRHVGPRILPWSYIGNTIRYVAQSRRQTRIAQLLPDAVLPPSPENRQIVVLVIGEAARGDHHGLLGYARDTSPFTSRQEVIGFPGGLSCATYTLAGAACILSHLRGEDIEPGRYETLLDYLARSGIHSQLRRNNSGTPPTRSAAVVTSADLRADCEAQGECTLSHDEILLQGVGQTLADPEANRQFLVFHLAGSHGPNYTIKYPASFSYFTPECRTTVLDQCTRDELVNAYDNSIRYTDWVLSQIIDELAQLEDTEALMLYVSDHGQSLGENGIYLHGLPNALAPESQRSIPLMMWMNDAFAQAQGIDREQMRLNAQLNPVTAPQSQVFHTILAAFGIHSPVYEPQRNLLATHGRGEEN